MTPGKDEAPKGMRVADVRIRRVENGHIGSVGFETDPDAKKDGGKKESMACCPYVPDKQYVLGDRAAIHEFLDNALGMKEPEKKKTPRRFGNSV